MVFVCSVSPDPLYAVDTKSYDFDGQFDGCLGKFCKPTRMHGDASARIWCSLVMHSFLSFFGRKKAPHNTGIPGIKIPGTSHPGAKIPGRFFFRA